MWQQAIRKVTHPTSRCSSISQIGAAESPLNSHMVPGSVHTDGLHRAALVQIGVEGVAVLES